MSITDISSEAVLAVVSTLAALATLIALVALEAPPEAYTAVGLLFTASFGAQRVYKTVKERSAENEPDTTEPEQPVTS